jgi:hypothetical protein
MPAAIPETKGRTIAEYRAIADGVASGNLDAAGEAIRAPLVAGAALAHPLSAWETQGRLAQMLEQPIWLTKSAGLGGAGGSGPKAGLHERGGNAV